MTSADLNLRAGPGTEYQRLATIPEGSVVAVTYCGASESWCYLHWQGYEGWVSSRYLAAAPAVYVETPLYPVGGQMAEALIDGKPGGQPLAATGKPGDSLIGAAKQPGAAVAIAQLPPPADFAKGHPETTTIIVAGAPYIVVRPWLWPHAGLGGWFWPR